MQSEKKDIWNFWYIRKNEGQENLTLTGYIERKRSEESANILLDKIVWMDNRTKTKRECKVLKLLRAKMKAGNNGELSGLTTRFAS